MATKLIYFSDGGLPATGLVPSWDSLKLASDGTDYTPQPTFTEIGGGWYKFDINPSEKLVGVVDGSASLVSDAERYQPVYFDQFDFIYQVLVVPSYDEDSDALRFLSFIMQNGIVISSGLSNIDLSLYDSAHTLQFTVNGTSFTNGVASLTKSSPGLTKNLPYYVTATITLNGVDFTSVDTLITVE